MADAGRPVRQIAAALAISPHTVSLWLSRFYKGGLGALEMDQPGRGRKPLPPPVVNAVVEDARLSAEGGSPLTVRELARRHGISAASVSRILNK
jgi:transposase-like protein